jgi:NAD(P)-dependent dehydrogenase (short-subunit alcohol dehydrogenase family)
MQNTKSFQNLWAIILGGSSGFGLASAKKMAKNGMNICIVHRDRRGSMERIEKEFEQIKACGVELLTYNVDALKHEDRENVLNDLASKIKTDKVRLVLHSIAFGSLKLIAPQAIKSDDAIEKLANKLSVNKDNLQANIDELFADGHSRLSGLTTPPTYNSELLLDEEELLNTVQAMGVSLLSWTKSIYQKGLFDKQANVIGLTSEGNAVAWLGYAAVSAAKAALESISRSIAKEYGPYGIRSNIVQPGVTDTPALRLIPGSKKLVAQALERNPLGRITQVEDVANVISFLASEDSAWINGSLIRVDGGEHISG